jgi:tRNA threonylcarbamoyladenosine biosynthesis protein TsaB
VALLAPCNGAAILAAIDARRDEIYAGVFRFDADGLAEPLDRERVLPASALALPEAEAWNVLGTGWSAHGDAIRERLPSPPCWADGDRYPQARDVARLAAPLFAAGKGVPPEQALPVYLRDKVALTLEEQRGSA